MSETPEIPSPPTDSAVAKKRRDMPVGMMVSIGIHALLFFILITVKVVQYIVEPPSDFKAPPAQAYNVTPKKEIKAKIEQRQRSGGGGRPPKVAIAVDRPSSFMVPKVDVTVSSMHGKLGSRGSGRGLGDGDGDGEGPGSGGGKGGGTGGIGLGRIVTSIGGISVDAERLGVVVDNSGSMKPYLEELRKDINRKFKDRADYAEANGCSINMSSPAFKALKEMAEGGKVDAIFWFSDLNDPLSMDALDVLGEIFLDKKVKLYVRSIKLHPTDDAPKQKERKKEGKRLLDIIKDSGGKLRVDKM